MKETCPKCGCQCYDPFQGEIKMHDVNVCGSLPTSPQEDLETDLDYELDDSWDTIATAVGFDDRGLRIQNEIRRFVEMKVKESKNKVEKD
jgi:hypothetical protein